MLLSGPPGLGKTSMAHILARELGVTLHVTSGPALVKKGDLAGLLTALAPRDILFIDEIHRLSPAVEEALYPAMEDYRFDVVLGAGIGAQTMEMKLERFTLIGATTRTGLLAAPLRDRFPIQERLDYYAAAELEEIARRAARKLALPGRAGRRSRSWPPGPAARRASPSGCCSGPATSPRWRGTAGSPARSSDRTLRRLDVDERGLDAMDRRILATVIDTFGGGPVGIDAVAAAVGEERGTIEDVYEPFLVREGYLARTPRGRDGAAERLRATSAATGRGASRASCSRRGARRAPPYPSATRRPARHGPPHQAGRRPSQPLRRPAIRTSRQPATNPPTWAKKATPVWTPKTTEASWPQEPDADEEPGRQVAGRPGRDDEDDEGQHPGPREEDQVAAQHPGDGAAGADHGQPRSALASGPRGGGLHRGGQRLGRRGHHPGTRGRRPGSARRPSASSTLFPKIQRKSMLPPRCTRPPCRNMLVRTVSGGGTRSRGQTSWKVRSS